MDQPCGWLAGFMETEWQLPIKFERNHVNSVRPVEVLIKELEFFFFFVFFFFPQKKEIRLFSAVHFIVFSLVYLVLSLRFGQSLAVCNDIFTSKNNKTLLTNYRNVPKVNQLIISINESQPQCTAHNNHKVHCILEVMCCHFFQQHSQSNQWKSVIFKLVVQTIA